MTETLSFRASRALVIGIDGYEGGIPPLRTAVADARRVAEVLRADHGYAATHLLTEDVSLARLRHLLAGTLPAEVGPDDRVLIYFAGHGIALDGDDGPAGFLVPQDARRDDRASFLPMTELSACLEALPCRHLLLVLDCCFAGAFRWSSTRDLGAPPEVMYRERFDRFVRDPAWQVLTSAAYDQKALDVLSGETIGVRGRDADATGHSPFAAAFLRALAGEADVARGKQASGDGVVTATELYLFLRDAVEVGAEGIGHRQTPGFWPLKRHDKGEFIHLVPGHVLDLPPAPVLTDDSSPWRGLRSYDEEQAPLFFGRSAFVASLAERVKSRPLTVVLGASGTGKSSVVKAGLLASLRAREPDAWAIRPPFRPGKSPLAALAAQALPGEAADPDAVAHRLAVARTDPEALARRVGEWSAGDPAGPARLLVVVDQFEELITLCLDADERDQFLRQLDRALAEHPDRLRVVLTLRSDFEPQFAHTPLEEEWLASRIVVPAWTLDEYREAIEGPASARVLYFRGHSGSQAFINRLIGDVANTPGALPLLSFTLSELYRRHLASGSGDRSLAEADYESLGGVGGSLRNRADEIYDGLPDDAHRATLERAMLRMVSVEGGELARKRVLKEEMVYDSDDENRRVAEVLRRMDEARLVVSGKDEDDRPIFEPAHDELIRGWSRLLGWTRGALDSLQLRQVLSPAVRDWSRDASPDSGKLWHANPRLGLLSAELGLPHQWHRYLGKRIRDRVRRTSADAPPRPTWLNRDESRFVAQSLARRHRTTSVVVTTTVATVVVLAGLSVFAFLERGNAVASAGVAKTNETKAKAALAESQSTLAKSLLSGLGLAGDAPIGVMEAESLWRLATIPEENEPVRILFLKHALESGTTARQLRLRSAPSVLAAIGLDEGRKARAIREVVMPTLAASKHAGEELPSEKEVRLAASSIGFQLGLLQGDKVEDQAFAAATFAAALSQLEGSVQITLPLLSILRRAASRLSPADAASALPKIEHTFEKTQPQIHFALNLALADLVPRLDAGERRKVLKHLAESTAGAEWKRRFWSANGIILVAQQGIDAEDAAEAALPLLDTAAVGADPARAKDCLRVLQALAPSWDDSFAARCGPALRAYGSADVAKELGVLGASENNPMSGWSSSGGLISLAPRTAWEAPSSQLLVTARNLSLLYRRSPGFPVDDFYGTLSRAMLIMAERMTRDDRATLIAAIRSVTERDKFEWEKGRDELATLPARIAALPDRPIEIKLDLSLENRKAWARAVSSTMPAGIESTNPRAKGPPTPRAAPVASKAPALSSLYPTKNQRNVPDEPGIAAQGLIDFLAKPVPDNMFDMPNVLTQAAILQRIAPTLPESTRREAASAVIRAILARVPKTSEPFPAADEAVAVSAALVGPGEQAAVIKTLLASGTDLLGGYQVPGDKIMTVSVEALGRFAGTLLARPDVEISDPDLIDILRYPTCVGNLRSAVLARLERSLKPPARYSSVWALMDDLKARFPALHRLAQSPPIRPTEVAGSGRPGPSASDGASSPAPLAK